MYWIQPIEKLGVHITAHWKHKCTEYEPIEKLVYRLKPLQIFPLKTYARITMVAVLTNRSMFNPYFFSNQYLSHYILWLSAQFVGWIIKGTIPLPTCHTIITNICIFFFFFKNFSKNAALTGFYQVLTTSSDISGIEFISSLEGKFVNY